MKLVESSFSDILTSSLFWLLFSVIIECFIRRVYAIDIFETRHLVRIIPLWWYSISKIVTSTVVFNIPSTPFFVDNSYLGYTFFLIGFAILGYPIVSFPFVRKFSKFSPILFIKIKSFMDGRVHEAHYRVIQKEVKYILKDNSSLTLKKIKRNLKLYLSPEKATRIQEEIEKKKASRDIKKTVAIICQNVTLKERNRIFELTTNKIFLGLLKYH